MFDINQGLYLAKVKVVYEKQSIYVLLPTSAYQNMDNSIKEVVQKIKICEANE